MSQILVYVNKDTTAFLKSKKMSVGESDSVTAGRLLRELAEQNEMRTKFDLREGK